jgi:hypothetical protein
LLTITSSAKTPCQAFSDVKKIYAYRSAIVHGSKNLESKRVIRVDEENVINTHVLAVTYLRMMLKVLLGNSEFRDPKKVDEKLLLGGGVH